MQTRTEPPSVVGRAVVLAGGVLFVASLLGFLEFHFRRWQVPADPMTPGATVTAGAIDLALFTVFALHHSVFARLGVRDWVRSRLSPRYERSFYVWISSALFILVYAAWRPVPGILWSVSGWPSAPFVAAQVTGIVIAVAAARRLDVFDLSGIRQAFDRPTTRPVELVTSGLYGLVRHPIYLGWVLLVWLPPVMTGTRLAFAAISTAYLVAVVPLEERGLVRALGNAYREYCAQVRWRMVPYVY
jgi:methanethiol S-methyltransferase